MNKSVNEEALDILFRKARTYNNWQSRPVEDDKLKAIYDLMKMAPTGANCCPLRIVFVKSDAEKERLKPTLMGANVDKTMQAPVTAILAYDMEFHNELPFLFPHTDAKSWYEGKDAAIKSTAELNGSLQAGYFMLAARSLGLDCGPMAGFNSKKVDEAFLKDTKYKSYILCNLGYGDDEGMFDRLPRFDFDKVCKIC